MENIYLKTLNRPEPFWNPVNTFIHMYIIIIYIIYGLGIHCIYIYLIICTYLKRSCIDRPNVSKLTRSLRAPCHKININSKHREKEKETERENK